MNSLVQKRASFVAHALFLGALALFTTIASAGPHSILERQERPEAADLLKMSPKTLDEAVGSSETDAKVLSTLMKLLEGSVDELLEMQKENPADKILIYARDGEWLYDAFQTLMIGHPNEKKIRDSVVLFNMSRPIADSSSNEQLRSYMEANGMNIKKLLRGEGRYIWLDTGERGSIFLKLYEALLDEIPEGDPKRAEKIRNLFSGIVPRMLASAASSTEKELQSYLKKIDENTSNSDIVNWLESNHYFDEILKSRRKEIGIPSDRYQRHRWVVDHIEYYPHWNGRAARLNADGTKVVKFDSSSGYSSNPGLAVDRVKSLQMQRKVVEYFSKASVRKKFAKRLDLLALPSKTTAKPEKKVAEEKTESPTKAGKDKKPGKGKKAEPEITELDEFAGMQFDEGERVKLPSGRVIEIIREIEKGKRGVVYKAKDAEGNHFAFKVAVDNDSETLESLGEEAKKAKALAKAKASHAKNIENGADFALKEWIDGVRSDQWLKDWDKAGRPMHRKDVKMLHELLRNAADRKAYIGDLNAKNLIWTGKEWIIVDSGNVRNDLSADEALERFKENMTRRWSKVNSAAAECLFENLTGGE